MYRVILFLFAVAAVSRADIDEKCIKIFQPHTMFCCSTPPPKPADEMDLNECFGLPIKPFSTCEKDTCMAKKKGYITADGNIDKTAIKDIIEKQFEDQPELVELVKDRCVDGDINMFGPKDMCDAIKIRDCIHMQFVLQCSEFRDDGDCSGTTALVEECSKKFI